MGRRSPTRWYYLPVRVDTIHRKCLRGVPKYNLTSVKSSSLACSNWTCKRDNSESREFAFACKRNHSKSLRHCWNSPARLSLVMNYAIDCGKRERSVTSERV